MRRRNDADRRTVLVALTAEGARRLAEVHAARTEFLADHMAGLDEPRLASLATALPVLDQIIESAAPWPSAGGSPGTSSRCRWRSPRPPISRRSLSA